jgi:hypothetical protein
MKAMRTGAFADEAAAAALGSIASMNGKAMVTPNPRKKVRRSNGAEFMLGYKITGGGITLDN